MSSLQKNVASQHIGFVLNNVTTGAPVTAGGAGTVVIDNGSQAACSGTFTHKGTGQWDYAPTQAETNGTSICFAFTGTSAIQVGMQFFTVGYNPTVANLPANLTQVNAHSVTDTTSGVPDVNVKNFGTTAVTGRDIGASVLLASGQKVDVDTIKTNPVVNAGTVTFPTGATLASTTNITAITGNITGNLTGSVGSVTAAITLPSIPANWITAAGINAAALNGKGDWSTTTPPTVAAIATGVWQDTTAGDFTVASSIGKSLFTSGNAPGAASGLALVGSNMGTASSVTGAVGSVTGNVGGNVTGSVGSVTAAVTLPSIPTNWITATGINAAALNGKGDWNTTTPPTASAIATGVWQDTTAGDFTVAGSIGKSLFTSGNAPGAASGIALVGSNMGTVSSVTGSVGSVTAAVTANTTQLAGQTVTAAAGVTFPTSVASPTNITAGTITTVTNLTNAPTVGDLTSTMKTSVENTVWNATMSSHLTPLTTGATLNGAGAAGDPWSVAIPAAYGAGTAGYKVGNGIGAAQTLTSGERASIADAVLDRDMSVGTDSGSPAIRTVRQALRFLRNKWSITTGTLTVFKEDDVTPSWTSTVATDSTAQPIVSNDPAGP